MGSGAVQCSLHHVKVPGGGQHISLRLLDASIESCNGLAGLSVKPVEGPVSNQIRGLRSALRSG